MTTTEKRFMAFIFRYLKDNGYPPGYSDMLVFLRQKDERANLAQIHNMLMDLQLMNYIELPYGLRKPRALRLVNRNAETKALEAA